jgi:hypothetical protein
MTYPAPICFDCKNFLQEFGLNCKAFPKGIPDEILFGENNHTKMLPDQGNEIVFEPIEDKEP